MKKHDHLARVAYVECQKHLAKIDPKIHVRALPTYDELSPEGKDMWEKISDAVKKCVDRDHAQADFPDHER